MDTLSPKKSKSSQPKQQNILVTYDSSLSQKIHSVYSRICTEYAAVSIASLQPSQQKQSNTLQLPLPLLESRKSLLTKRPAKKIHLLKFNKEIISSKKYFNADFTTWLHYCDKTCCRNQLEDLFPTMEIVQVAEKEDQNSIFSKATKLMHLDFIWLGVGGRLGVSLPEFVLSVKEFQNFQQFKIAYIQQFLQVLNSQLDPTLSTISQTNPESSSIILYELLKKCEQRLQTKLLAIEQNIQQLIIDSFSDHLLVSSPTYHTYYKLLKTRNYFKLIWIEQPVIKRYHNFLKSISKYQQIYKWVGDCLENFLVLDDYVYQFFFQKCAYQAHFIVNTGLLKLTYREIIQKNYKQIFRKFRPDFDQYFISLCKILKNRSGCIKQAVGSIIVKNKRILATGYNGTPIGSINCYNGGCRICNDSNKINTAVLSCNCIHAEYSAIMQAGIQSTVGCILYTTQLPCLWCAKVISQAKISVVVYLRSQSKLLEYDNQDRVYEIFKLANIELRQFTDRERRFSKV